jgi:simple sugar transport system ATP-binding protein
MSTAVRMANITKTFPGIVANDKVNFEVRKGEIHGLLGENGAGKTVLMNILYGLYKPDEGRIFINEKETRIESSATAIKNGIGMVHQHFMLIPSLTIAENIVLGREPTKNIVLLDMTKIVKTIKDASRGYGLEVDPKALVSDLPVGLQQRVEILKALYRGAQILILDEPTSVLTPQEVDNLFKAMRALEQQGKSVIFITHKLKEVCAVCDRITVLKKGKVVCTVEANKTNPQELAAMMVGREILSIGGRGDLLPGKTVLQVDRLQALNDRKLLALKDVAFEVHESEILGIAGVEGNGQTELVEVLTGLREATTGEISLVGKPITNISPHERIGMGLANVPEDRQKRGLILDFSVLENLILGYQDRPPFEKGWVRLDLKEASSFADELIEEYSIKTPSKNTLTRHLSGGTQQRVVLAREFSRKPKLIIASQPTRGLDIGATEFVHRKLIEMRDQGVAILLISADLDEILTLSDRIAVLYEGKIVAVKEFGKTNEFELGLLMTGGNND